MKDLTIDTLNTYYYCGIYYQQYALGNVPLHDDRPPIQIALISLMKWVAGKVSVGTIPEDHEIMNRIALVFSRLAHHGIPMPVGGAMNDLVLSLTSWVQHLSTTKIQSVMTGDRYVADGASVLYQRLLTTDRYLYLFNTRPWKHFVNSPHFLVPYLANQHKEFRVINFDSNKATFTFKDIPHHKVDPDRARTYLHSMMRGVANEVYIPKYQCSKIGCPHYNNCYFAWNKG